MRKFRDFRSNKLVFLKSLLDRFVDEIKCEAIYIVGLNRKSTLYNIVLCDNANY